MREDDGLRIATVRGAILVDPTSVGTLSDGGVEALFDPESWSARGEIEPAAAGRGGAWFIVSGARRWVLRHYRRGGFMARLSIDRYLWIGESRVRAFAEFRLLARLSGQGLPVPRPIGARYRRSGPTYRCDLITERVQGAVPLSAELAKGPLGAPTWHAIGAALARLHAAGVDHADLNAHNLLVGRGGAVSIIDFDRGRIRAAGAWSQANLQRLRRSLEKIARDLPAERFPASAWRAILEAYAVARTRGD